MSVRGMLHGWIIGSDVILRFSVDKRWEPLGGTFLCLVCLESDACLGTFFKGQFFNYYFGMRLQWRSVVSFPILQKKSWLFNFRCARWVVKIKEGNVLFTHTPASTTPEKEHQISWKCILWWHHLFFFYFWFVSMSSDFSCKWPQEINHTTLSPFALALGFWITLFYFFFTCY